MLVVHKQEDLAQEHVGPPPSFPLGNLREIASGSPAAAAAAGVGGDIHGAVFPYFARWRKAFGKVFVYWLGMEPSDPEFLKAATGGALGRLWGKPDVFRSDRMPTNLNAMVAVMEETTARMVGEWGAAVASGQGTVDVESGVVRNAAEIIARASFGIGDGDGGARVFEKLQAMQRMLASDGDGGHG